MASPWDKYPVPEITFGVEMEFNFALLKSLHKAFEAAGSGLPPGSPASAAHMHVVPESHADGPPTAGVIVNDDVVILDVQEDPKQEPEVEIKVEKSESSTGKTEEVSEDSFTTVTSFSEKSQHSIQRYVRALLNHDLPHSPKTPSLIAPVIWVSDSPQTTADKWYVTTDASVFAGRAHFALYKELQDPNGKTIIVNDGFKDVLTIAANELRKNKNVRKMWRVGGVKLISPVLHFRDEEDWMSKFHQIHRNLSSKDEIGFMPGDQNAGLHVHVAIDGGDDVNLDSPLGLACLKNVVALYGLFEDEIGTWLPVQRRDDWMMIRRLRHGVDAQEIADGFSALKAIKTGIATEITAYYTPQLFTEWVYRSPDFFDLKKVTGGMKFVTVHLSNMRDNKPKTIEFRQHQGTSDPDKIQWWVTFVFNLVKYSYFLAQQDIEVRDFDLVRDATLPADRFSMVHGYTDGRSILDVVGMPAEGKEHFARMKKKYYDPMHDAQIELDKWFIERRARHLRTTGEYAGPKFDAKIKKSFEYALELKRLEDKYELKVPLEQKIIDIHG